MNLTRAHHFRHSSNTRIRVSLEELFSLRPCRLLIPSVVRLAAGAEWNGTKPCVRREAFYGCVIASGVIGRIIPRQTTAQHHNSAGLAFEWGLAVSWYTDVFLPHPSTGSSDTAFFTTSVSPPWIQALWPRQILRSLHSQQSQAIDRLMGRNACSGAAGELCEYRIVISPCMLIVVPP